jgi:hypothetical protein
MTGLPERAAATALEDLTDRSILISDPESRAFFLPPLTAKFIRTRRPEAVDPDWRRAHGPRLRPGDAIRRLPPTTKASARWTPNGNSSPPPCRAC